MAQVDRGVRRLDTLSFLADGVAREVSLELYRRYGLPDGVRFVDGTAFEDICRDYWRLIDAFKRTNGFPEKSRINSPKKAALTLVACNRNPHRMFAVNPAYPALDQSHVQYCRLRFAIEITKLFLDIREEDIQDRHKRDIMVCLLKLGNAGEPTDLAMHLLCLYMDTYWTNIGRHGSEDTTD